MNTLVSCVVALGLLVAADLHAKGTVQPNPTYDGLPLMLASTDSTSVPPDTDDKGFHLFAENAPRAADVVLLGEIAMGLALIAGAVLARLKRYRGHAWCQAAVVLLNLLPVALFMLPSYWRAVAPGLLTHIGRPYYWLATVHGVFGICAELLVLYIVLAAGTKILPARCRLVRYKPWMRFALALWWLVLLLGAATYVRWYR